MVDRAERLEAIAFPDRAPSFGALIKQLSEPDAGKAADNFVSNEDSYPRVAGEVAARAPRNSVYLGVGPDQNFTLIAPAHSRLAFILDFRRRNLRLHLIHKALVALSEDRVAYLTRLTCRLPPTVLGREPTAAELVAAFGKGPMDRSLLEKTRAEVRQVLEPLHVLDEAEWADLATIQAKLAGPGLAARFLALTMYPTLGRLITTADRSGKPAQWLALDSTYQRIRALQQTDRIVPLVGDFSGSNSLKRLAGWLIRHRLEVGVIYLSDVEFFLLRSGRFSAFIANLTAIPWAKEAILIRTSTREIDHPDRVKGDSSTTIVRSVSAFLKSAQADRIRTHDDLFGKE